MKKLKNKYDTCPCWCSPGDPEGTVGTCENPFWGECRYPSDPGIWVNCKQFATACKNCGNWWCELHIDYKKFRKCGIRGCKKETYYIVNDNGVDVPHCEDHYKEHTKVMDEIHENLRKAIAAKNKAEHERIITSKVRKEILDSVYDTVVEEAAFLYNPHHMVRAILNKINMLRDPDDPHKKRGNDNGK
jgi:hypothetical protein